MRNAHRIANWSLTPASCLSSYATGREIATVTTVKDGKPARQADGYLATGCYGNGNKYYLTRDDMRGTWDARRVDANNVAAMSYYRTDATSIESLLERL